MLRGVVVYTGVHEHHRRLVKCVNAEAQRRLRVNIDIHTDINTDTGVTVLMVATLPGTLLFCDIHLRSRVAGTQVTGVGAGPQVPLDKPAQRATPGKQA